MMQRGDENVAPVNGKRGDKNIVSKLCAQYEVKVPKAEAPAPKKAGASAKANFSVPEDITRKNLKIDAERASVSSEDPFPSVTPPTPSAVSPSRLPFKRIHTEESFPAKDAKLALTQCVKKAKTKGVANKKEGGETVTTAIRFRPGGPEASFDTGERSACVEDCSVVLKSVDKKDSVRYTFDEVCPEHVTQEEMFERAARKLTDDFVDGYNATIFAYGQTGSGKTHTMLGDLDLRSTNRGITPRVFSHVFSQLEAKQAEGPFELKLSFLQIYNEKCQDLLNPAVNTKIGHVEEDLKIRESPEGVFVEGLSKAVCKSAQQALDCVSKGIRNRKTGKTAMNTVSSRSHSILTLELSGKHYISRLNLIDLAGSENQKTSTSSNAAQQNEANNINLSLSYLGQCLREAVKGPGGANHVNYRNSKLTKLLKDSLGGTAKTCVIATVSTLPAFAAETASTLKFAATIKLIQTQAVKHPVKGAQATMESEVARLKQELRIQEAEAQAKLEMQAAEYEAKLAAAVSIRGVDSANLTPAPTGTSSTSSNDNIFGVASASDGCSRCQSLQASVRSLEVEVAELIQTREEFASRLTSKEQELARVRGGELGGADQKYEAQMQEMKSTYDSLQRQLSSKAGAHTLEAEHVNQALQTSQRMIDALQLEIARMQTEASETREDLRFMIEKETSYLAKAEQMERELVELRLAKAAASTSSATEEQTIRRLVAEKAATATETEMIGALQQEVLRLQANSEKDLAQIDELRTQLHQLQESCAAPSAAPSAASAAVPDPQIGAQVASLKTDLEAKTAELNKQREKCKAHMMELSKFRFERKNTANLEQEHKACKSDISKVTAENKDLLRQVQHLSQQLSQERSDQDELCRFARNEEGEKHRALLEKIESDFGGKLPLGNQARLFIRSGLLKRVSKHGKLLEYNFFLFTDVLIYASAAKHQSQGKFKAHRVIHLGLCRLVDIQPRPDSEANTLYSNSFRLITPQKSDVKEPRNRGFYISCDTPAEKQSWMTAILAQIEKIYSQPEGAHVQVPRVADVSAPERLVDGDLGDGPSMNARSSFSVYEEERRGSDPLRGRESSLDLNEDMKGEAEEGAGLTWSADDPDRPRAPSNESVVSRSRAGSVSSSVFSRMTEFTAADLPTSHTSLMRARVQAQDYCRLCVRLFSSSALHYSRHKASCGCCDDKNVCKGCCSSKAVPPRSLDGKERRVCLACHGGITRLVGRGIPRLSVEYE